MQRCSRASVPRRRASFTSGQPPPLLLPLAGSAGRHYRAARASAAAASSQRAARAPVLRGHTPGAGPAPLRLSVARTGARALRASRPSRLAAAAAAEPGVRGAARSAERTIGSPPRRGGRAREWGASALRGARSRRSGPGSARTAGCGLPPPTSPTEPRDAGVRGSLGTDAWSIFLDAGPGMPAGRGARLRGWRDLDAEALASAPPGARLPPFVRVTEPCCPVLR